LDSVVGHGGVREPFQIRQLIRARW
jgi:hypothetical protein